MVVVLVAATVVTAAEAAVPVAVVVPDVGVTAVVAAVASSLHLG